MVPLRAQVAARAVVGVAAVVLDRRTRDSKLLDPLDKMEPLALAVEEVVVARREGAECRASRV